MYKILVCDDDREIVEAIEIYLSQEGYQILKAYDGIEALEILEKEEVNLLIIDVMMPRLDGIRATLKIREKNSLPIIILSAKSEDTDKILGLNIGADDYVTKPFSVAVLCKKIAAVFAQLEMRTPKHNVYDDGRLCIDFSTQTATLNGAALALTPQEYRALALFVAHPRIILTKRQLLEALWDVDGAFVDAHTLATIVSRIRKKIKADGYKYIKTAYGMGYQWLPPENNVSGRGGEIS